MLSNKKLRKSKGGMILLLLILFLSINIIALFLYLATDSKEIQTKQTLKVLDNKENLEYISAAKSENTNTIFLNEIYETKPNNYKRISSSNNNDNNNDNSGVGSPDSECKDFGFDFGVAKWECNGAWKLDEEIFPGTSVTGTCKNAFWDVGSSNADGIVIKSGNIDHGGYYYSEQGITGTINLPKDISHITFCGYHGQPNCGNSIIDNGEECDDGDNNGKECTPGYDEPCTYCSLECENKTKTDGYCGDEIINGDEKCEFDSDCEDPVCNDKCILNDYYEYETAENNCDKCSCEDNECEIKNIIYNDTRCIEPPECGDGNLDAGEECDDGNTINDDECSNNCEVNECIIKLNKTESIDPTRAGEELSYYIEATNIGTKRCTGGGVQLKEYYDSNTIFLSSDPLPTSSNNLWNFGILDPGEKEEITINMQVNETVQCGKILINKICIWANELLDWQCITEQTSVGCPTECGDGHLDLGEECDDNNNANGDGCDENCMIEVCEHDVGIRYSYGNSFGTGIAIKPKGTDDWLNDSVELTQGQDYIIKYIIDNKIENSTNNIHVIVKINGIILAEYNHSINKEDPEEIDLDTSGLIGSHNISVYVEKINETDCNLTDNYAKREITIKTECCDDEDCPEDEYSEEYCYYNDVWKNLTDSFCKDGKCLFNISSILLEDCGIENYSDEYCYNNDVYQNHSIPGCENNRCTLSKEINKTQECGEDSYEEVKYCYSEDVWINKSKELKGCEQKECFYSSELKNELFEDCGEDSCDDWGNYICEGKNKTRTRTCYDKGCEIESCFNDPEIEKQSEECAYDCVNGECTEPKCGDGHLDLGEECDDGNLVNGDGCDENCITEKECTENSECDKLDRDYCYGSIIRHDEGICVDYECKVNESEIEDCGLKDGITGCGEFEWDCSEEINQVDCVITDILPRDDLCNNSCNDLIFNNGLCNAITYQCEYTQENCSDGNTCTEDICNTESGCSNPPEQLSTPCEADDLECTTDHCDGSGNCILLEDNCDECCNDEDCPKDDYSEEYCYFGDIWKNLTDSFCKDGKCLFNISSIFLEDCGKNSYEDWNYYCIGKEIWKNKTDILRGCSNGECFENKDYKNEYLDYCEQECIDGECKNECESDSDCPKDYYEESYCGGSFCPQSVYKDFHDFSCSSRKKCVEKITPKLIDDCDFTCLEINNESRCVNSDCDGVDLSNCKEWVDCVCIDFKE